MDFSFVIVTKNRSEALSFTLKKLQNILQFNNHEVLVFIDGCEETEKIKSNFSWVKWFGVSKSIGASPARNMLYKNAVGNILIGLDDDAHLISENSLKNISSTFQKNPKLGIIAFQEIKGVFDTDELALEQVEKEIIQYQTNDFIGCGFAIKNEVYKLTNGFPLWMDIYGEETCVAYEVLNANYEIYYDNSIIVNHRVDKISRQKQGKFYFRFEKQLINTASFFIVYYKNPLILILKLFLHNFKKYALQDFTYFKLFWKSFFLFILKLPKILKHRNPLSNKIILKIKTLKPLKY